jgi:hypothetical protein
MKKLNAMVNVQPAPLLGFLAFLLCISFPSKSATAQTKQTTEQSKPLTCESNIVEIESRAKLIVENLKQAEKVVIIVAKLGRLEKSSRLNDRRLFNIKQRLIDLGVSTDRIITAVSESGEEYGSVEIYLNGLLITKLLAPRNKDLCVSCCGPNERFYPTKRNSK